MLDSRLRQDAARRRAHRRRRRRRTATDPRVGLLNVLVVGYGNTLRCDDAAGRYVARLIAARRLPGVTVLELVGLVPELAEPVARARRVVFVDAAVGDAVATSLLDAPAGGPAAALTHVTDPRAVLALAERLHGRTPQAWMVTVPATDLDIGERLSATTAAAVDEAVVAVLALVT